MLGVKYKYKNMRNVCEYESNQNHSNTNTALIAIQNQERTIKHKNATRNACQ